MCRETDFIAEIEQQKWNRKHSRLLYIRIALFDTIFLEFWAKSSYRCRMCTFGIKDAYITKASLESNRQRVEISICRSIKNRNRFNYNTCPPSRCKRANHWFRSIFFSSSSIPLHTISLARIVIFMIAILAHGRQVEWTARLDFLWQLQASHEKREMAVLQESNKHILYNLLPAHVAAHFLDNQFRNNMVNILVVKHTISCIYTPNTLKMLVCFVHLTKFYTTKPIF